MVSFFSLFMDFCFKCWFVMGAEKSLRIQWKSDYECRTAWKLIANGFSFFRFFRFSCLLIIYLNLITVHHLFHLKWMCLTWRPDHDVDNSQHQLQQQCLSLNHECVFVHFTQWGFVFAQNEIGKIKHNFSKISKNESFEFDQT